MKTLIKTLFVCVAAFSFLSFETEKQEPSNIQRIKTSIHKSVEKLDFQDLTLYKVTVNINNANDIKGIAKFEELIPSGFVVTNIYTDFGKATFDSEKAKVTFLTLNGREQVKITYYLKGELPIQPNGDSKFSFVNGDKIDTIAVVQK